MNIFKRISPEWALRIGFAVMYLYSGFDLMTHPTAWYWALPFWLKNLISHIVNLDTYLRFQGAVEIVFALVLLAWFAKPLVVKIVAVLSALEFAVILALAFLPWSAANFLITFRDLGLLGGLIALFLIFSDKSSERDRI